MPTPRCSAAGWRTRIELLLKRDERGGDLLGQPKIPLYKEWSLSREKFRVANDGIPYVLTEFISWYLPTNAQTKWDSAPAATAWETHVALLRRLRVRTHSTVQRVALMSLDRKSVV